MQHAVNCYREIEPCESLKPYVRALFSFVPGFGEELEGRRIFLKALFGPGDPYTAPLFADGHSSLVFHLGMMCQPSGLWRHDLREFRGIVVGATTAADPVWNAQQPAMLGAYFHAAQFSSFTTLPARELTNRIVAVDDVWGTTHSELPAQFAELGEAARIDHLESLLLRQLRIQRQSDSAARVSRIARYVVRCKGQVTVEHLAAASGTSRQHLTRLFRECIGISPKLYCRLARFQSGLVHVERGGKTNWADVALELGYADQSHMIAEFRQFTGLTPQQLCTEPLFHPFIQRAKNTIVHSTPEVRIGFRKESSH
jgi:AraC-like DNA-binding protein